MAFTPLEQATGAKTGKSSNFSPLDSSMTALSHSQRAVDQLFARPDPANPYGISPQSGVPEGALPLAGGIAGGIGGGILGIPGGPAGVFAGGVAGAGFGGGLGQAAEQKLTGKPLDLKQVGKTGLTYGVAEAVGLPAAFGLKAIAPAVMKVAKKAVAPVTNFFARRAEKKAVDASIDAVYNSPTGAKFTKASGQVLSGKREIKPASIFKEQQLSPDEQAVNLGTRLKDLKLGKDPVKNSQILADEFANTEAKLQKALAPADPEVKYLADKPTLGSTLDRVKVDAPQEFRIKDSQSMVNRVVDFAKKVVDSADDSINGIREARKAFDAQARREFPSAFKPDGTIDTKTPAGYAIKTARDNINEHLYNTAPNGSEIQTLIGREADLYRAAQVSLEKATKGEGKTTLQQWAKENPTKAALLGLGTTAVAGGIGGAAYGGITR